MEHWYSGLQRDVKVEPYSGPVECPECHNIYWTDIVPQRHHKEIDYDICPYCGVCNHTTMTTFITNKKYNNTNTCEDAS